MPPKYANGKICYVEIPSADVARSAAFYRAAFGWEIRQRGDGSTAFDDAVGEVSGAFVTGRPPARETGLLVYIMVADIAATMRAVAANGGRIVEPPDPDAPEVTARFRDPAGNVVGLYQERTLAEWHSISAASGLPPSLLDELSQEFERHVPRLRDPLRVPLAAASPAPDKAALLERLEVLRGRLTRPAGAARPPRD